MLTKRTSKNQITLPVALLKQLPDTEYFEASVEQGALVLRPVKMIPAVDLEELRAFIKKTGAKETDVGKAVTWARRRPRLSR